MSKEDTGAWPEEELKSKTQIKQEAETLKKLGLEIVNLGKKDLAKLPLDDETRDAIALAQKIRNKHEGFRRQLQFIGKRLRNVDIEPLQLAMDKIRNKHNQATAALHHLEELRDALIADGDSKINQVMADHPQLDRQKLRQLIRQANKEKAQEKPPKAARELFKYLRESELD